MNELMPLRVTSKPTNSPIALEQEIVISIANNTGTWYTHNTPNTMLENKTLYPRDRSISPEIKTSVIPITRIIGTDSSSSTEEILYREVNVFVYKRVNITIYKIESFLDGDCDEIIDALILKDRTERLSGQ